jgi:hypothetical protein
MRTSRAAGATCVHGTILTSRLKAAIYPCLSGIAVQGRAWFTTGSLARVFCPSCGFVSRLGRRGSGRAAAGPLFSLDLPLQPHLLSLPHDIVMMSTGRSDLQRYLPPPPLPWKLVGLSCCRCALATTRPMMPGPSSGYFVSSATTSRKNLSRSRAVICAAASISMRSSSFGKREWHRANPRKSRAKSTPRGVGRCHVAPGLGSPGFR